MKNTNIGFCKICGNECELTFEHVPPKSTFNKKTSYKILPLIDYLAHQDSINQQITGKIHQGGTGFYSLCTECNSFLGRKYVKPFGHLVNNLSKIVLNTPSNHFVIEMKQLQLLKILKQILSMFVSINFDFRENHPNIINFIMDENLKYLPDKYRIFIYLNTEGNLRHLPLMIKGSFSIDFSVLCSEITFPPLGYVLTIDYDSPINYLTDITQFKNYNLHDSTDVKFELYKLPTHYPVHLDYRNLDEIK